jgi:hypothetical protein
LFVPSSSHRCKRTNPKSLADEALDYIGKLYGIEKDAQRRQLEPDQIRELREQKTKPLLDEFKDWLEAKMALTRSKGLLG